MTASDTLAFATVASAFEELEGTSSRKQLTAILANLLREVEPDAIAEVAYLLQGRVAPLYEPVEFGVDFLLRGSDFQQRVWRGLAEIPYGTTVTYGALAERVADRTKTRAVAAAVGRNPLSVVIPCHRVIGASGSLTGYAGGLERKRWLLDHEAAASGAMLSL